MKTIDWILAAFEAIFWYAALYTFFYTIKNPVNIHLSTLVILVFAYIAVALCPFVRHTTAWKQTWKER